MLRGMCSHTTDNHKNLKKINNTHNKGKIMATTTTGEDKTVTTSFIQPISIVYMRWWRKTKKRKGKRETILLPGIIDFLPQGRKSRRFSY